ncbi:DUF4429 domain-containing protein [Streptomyces sp. SM12]|uniref:DUF4429 domain-containing protein n=1 Tax=Streptomyces sp. SM12 TaxID=1071602 RepID=UPI000CD50406|nr:DUF4429 domain-containing protein [Streptomyces sp. SM12]
MAEITQKDGSWSFDGEVLRIVPGRSRGVHAVRTQLGELIVPLAAMAGVSYETGRKRGRLRLRLRAGADPFAQATSGGLQEAADPYSLEVDSDRAGLAEYLVDEVRNSLLLDQVPVNDPADRYLMPGPTVPVMLNGSDGKIYFDGERLKIEWGWATEEVKKSAGTRSLALEELTGVEWQRPTWENGWFRVLPRGAHVAVKPSHDPNCVVLWGLREARETSESALLAAAVTARLPHPYARETEAVEAAGPIALTKGDTPSPAPAGARGPGEHGQDALLRRLRELGELHESGVLTDEEFARAKTAVLDQL